MKIKKLLMPFALLSLSITPVLTTTSCNNGDQTGKVTKITVEANDSIMKVGQTTKLTATVEPSDAKDKTFTWKVEDPEYGTITSDGAFTASKIGTAIISAIANDGSKVAGSTTITIVDASTETETAKDYIFDRSFVLLCEAGESGAKPCRGTGWILSDATPEDPNDYDYYVATNWHVQQGFVESLGFPQNMYFGCSETEGVGPTSTTNFVQFGQDNYVKEDDDKFKWRYDSDTVTIIVNGKEVTGTKGIDFHIARANFANAAVEPQSKTAQIAKAKLDKLNNLTKNKKPINQIAENVTDSKHFEGKNLYTGGYPVNASDSKSYWEYHDLNAEGIKLQYFSNKEIPLQGSRAHATEPDVDNPLIDCAPQYSINSLTIRKDAHWMDGGASGSMLIGNFGSSLVPIWKVCGIYWGGWDNTSGEYFIPSFTIMNSEYKDFISSYITIK